MSLFKAREWWTSDGDAEEEYNFLAVGSIVNKQKQNIIIGSLSGLIKIFEPKVILTEENETIGYKPDHLILEKQLNAPIVQISIGKFLTGSEQQICILHPYGFVVYTVKLSDDQSDHGMQATLWKVYQHNLNKHSYSLITGHFGSFKGKELVGILSLDGYLSIFEQENKGFSCAIPEILVPGPLAYVASSDSIIVEAADWNLYSYKFQNLGQAANDEKKINSEWNHILNESTIDIQVFNEPGNVSSVLVLTNNSFSCYKESGNLKFYKKLDYIPSCFTPYFNVNRLFICIASHSNNVLVYKEAELCWAAQVSFVPVAIQVANFNGIRGSLVLLNEEGSVHVCYLGTDPSLFVAPPRDIHDINYEETDKELSHLQKIIVGSTKDAGNVLQVQSTENGLSVNVSVSDIEFWNGPTNISVEVPTATIAIKLSVYSPVKSVFVQVESWKPLRLSQSTFYFEGLYDSQQLISQVYLSETYVPCSLEVTVCVSYIMSNGSHRVVTKQCDLPLRLVVNQDKTSKEAEHKIMITSNETLLNMADVFPDYIFDGESKSSVGLAYYEGNNVSILSSRSTNRYRFQTDSFPSLWLILQAAIKRMEHYWAQQNREKVPLAIVSQLPVYDLFMEIDAHLLRRKNLKQLLDQLEKRAIEFRSIQRRLLTKYKDKIMQPLTNLDHLMEGCYKQIIQTTYDVYMSQKGLEQDACQLSSSVSLILNLIMLQYDSSPQENYLLMAVLSPVVYSLMDMGWEETVDCSITFMLRAILSKSSKESFIGSVLSMPSDTTSMKKHIGVLIDRISKGDLKNFSSSKSNRTNDFDDNSVLDSDKMDAIEEE